MYSAISFSRVFNKLGTEVSRTEEGSSASQGGCCKGKSKSCWTVVIKGDPVEGEESFSLRRSESDPFRLLGSAAIQEEVYVASARPSDHVNEREKDFTTILC